MLKLGKFNTNNLQVFARAANDIIHRVFDQST